MQLIQTVTVGAGGAASITFSGIAGTYTDLMLVLNLRSNRASADNDGIGIQFNSDTGANYGYKNLRGNGASTVSLSATGATNLQIGLSTGSVSTANTFGNALLHIPNYGLTTSKTVTADVVNENNGATAYSSILAGSWSGTSAITAITIISTTSSNWEQYSTASLYGILKGSGGATAA